MGYEKKEKEILQTDITKGLTQEEAKRRLTQYQKNELDQEPQKTMVAMFLEQLNDPLIFILFVATAISLLLGEIYDAGIIVVVIAMNAIVGVVQEGKAQKALESLKKMTSPTALVKREGAYQEISASLLVPGDVVKLEAGRLIPADIHLVKTASLKVEESALTGESVPVEKDEKYKGSKEEPLGDRKDLAFMTTSVVYGRGEGIVIATGMNTQIGKIAGMIHEAKQEATPLQKRLGDLGKLLSIIAVVLCVLLFGIALLQKRDLFDMIITAISLAVAAVPEGLAAVVTIVLALSVSRMVKVHTIVRRLPSVETLGAVSVVCTDKTGTLTQNRMTVLEIFSNQKLVSLEELKKETHLECVEGFLLCNDASIEASSQGEVRIGDPTELALVELGKHLQIEKKDLEKQYQRVAELPFDSERKMMTTLHQRNHKVVGYTKGSVDVLLKRCNSILISGKVVPLTQNHKKEIERVMGQMAADALRILGLARKEYDNKREKVKPTEKELTFLGFVGMMDPAREEAAEAIRLFGKASVKTVMITGDHIDTAFAIAKNLKIAEEKSQCLSAIELNQMTDEDLAKRISNLRVFARVSPEHKVRIVKAFKSQGNIVAMTGDGVNDAPSLKSADIGIAMGKNGTDVAKNASDIILTDDNFATIERAIEEGRGIYENIKKSVLFLLSSNFGEIITMFLSMLVGLASPLKASHILWVNLITDSLPALALGTDENDRTLLMSKPPRNSKESLFAGGGLACTLFYGALIAGISLAAFLLLPYSILLEKGSTINLGNLMMVLESETILTRAQTYAFTVLGVSELFHAVGMRNVEQSIFKMNHFSNKLMIFSFLFGIFLQIIVTEIPALVRIFGTVQLSIREWIVLVLLSAVPMLAHELLILSRKLFQR